MDSLQYIQPQSENLVSQTNAFKVGGIKSVTQEKLLKSSKDLFGQKRSFGDISNRFGRTRVPKKEPTKEAVKKLHSKAAKPSSKPSQPFPEPDFRPDIEEIEDYDDVLPDTYKLSNETCTKFVKFWNRSSKIEHDCPPSPTPPLELIPLWEGTATVPPFELLSVDSDEDLGVYDLPPPIWGN